MRFPFFALAVAARLALLLCFPGAHAALFAAQPWDEPFAQDTGAILKAASAVPSSDAEVVLLLEEYRFSIKKNGKSVWSLRRVYRVATPSAVEDWAAVEQEWEPWHEQRPNIRARVISPDGSVHWLDPKTIADAPVAQFDPAIFSDARVVRAPLPAVAEGSVVEYEITERDTAALPGSGVVRELIVNTSLPIQRFHVSIDAAKGVPLRIGSSLMPASAVTRTESKGGTHVEVELGSQKPKKDFELSVPPGEPQYPSFRFSTGTSWRRVAAAYGRIVARQIDAVDAKSLLQMIGISEPLAPTPPRSVAQRITTQLQQRVRYTGVEFGQAAIVPNRPDEVIRRQYGDCKDKATLLVSLLRAAGLDAHLALLRAGTGIDIDPQLPGFGLFNHAIVFVGGKDPFWIDATAENARVGTLPLQDQGRRALLIGDSSSALVMTPESSAADNRIVHHIEVRFSESGKGTIHETLEAHGAFELQMRSVYGGDERQVRAALERFAKNSFGASSLGDFSVTKKGDFSQPFRLTIEAEKSSAVVTGFENATVQASDSFLFTELPFGLIAGLGTDTAEKTRKHDFAVPCPYRAEVHFKIYPPADFTPDRLPPAEHSTVAGATYSSQSKRDSDGAVQLDFSFELAKRRLTPAEFGSLRAELKKRLAESTQAIRFTYKAANLIAVGKTAAAMRMAHDDATKHPDSALVQMRFARFLMNNGAGHAAVAPAQRAVQLDPKSEKAWLTLAFVVERDDFGRLRRGDWNQSEAEKDVKKALQLDGSDSEAQMELPILLEYNAAGERYAQDAHLSQAVTLYQGILKKSQNPTARQNLVLTLLHLGRYREAQEAAKKLTGQDQAMDSIALTALTDGPDTAVTDSQNLYADNASRGQHLAQAAFLLFQLRKYRAVNDLLSAAQRLSANARLAQLESLWGSARAYEKILLPDTDPRSPVQRFLWLASKGAATNQELAAILDPHANISVWQRHLLRISEHLSVFRMGLRATGGLNTNLADFVLSQTTFSVTDPLKKAGAQTAKAKGGNPIYLVTAHSHMNIGFLSFFVVRENGHCKLIATGDGLASIGRIALDALDQGDLASAQRWLDAVKGNAMPESPRDEKGPAIRFLWAGTAPETRNAAFARAAAASLVGTYSGSAKAIAILKQVAAHPVRYMDRDDLNFAICEALRTARNWEELRDRSRLLIESRFYKDAGMRFLGEALMHLEQWPELAQAAEARLAISPDNHVALQFAAIAAMARGQFDQAASYLKRSKAAPFAAPFSDKLLAGWNAILAGKVTEETASDLEGGNLYYAAVKGPTYVYTLALAQLLGGKPGDCRRTMAIGLEMDGAKPSGLAWLVQGELMKSYSLPNAAAWAFGRARSADGFEGLDFAGLFLQKEKFSGGITYAK